MRNGFILVMLLMAMMFSLFASDPPKIDTGQVVKSEIVNCFDFAVCNFETSIYQSTAFSFMEFRRIDAKYNYIVKSPINLFHLYENPFTLCQSPKEDYGVKYEVAKT